MIKKNYYICRDVEHEEEVCRDYLEGPEAQDGLVRKSMKNIWTVEDVTDVDWKQQEPERSFFEVKLTIKISYSCSYILFLENMAGVKTNSGLSKHFLFCKNVLFTSTFKNFLKTWSSKLLCYQRIEPYTKLIIYIKRD